MTDTTPTDSENIRFILGAFGDNEALLDETEIQHALLLYPDSWRLAAAHIADSLASRALNNPTSFTLTGLMQVSWADRARSWANIAKSLRAEVAASEAVDGILGGVTSIQLTREAEGVYAEYSPRRMKGLRR
jgi:hypothetical protein